MVYLVLELLEAGVTPEEILERYYPNLQIEDIRAAIGYAASLIKEQEYVPFSEVS
jgi:uncharacterized protein (DUF433 family)